MPKISNRGNSIPVSPIRRLIPYADAAKAEGVKVYRLNMGQPDLASPAVAIEAMHNLQRSTLEYSPSQGTPELRRSIVNFYKKYKGLEINDKEILVTAGGTEALIMVFLCCMDPGDEVVTTEPGYANYRAFGALSGVTVKGVRSVIDDGYALPAVEEFEKAITEKTRAILICNPSNPTGYLYTREEVEALAAIAVKHDLFLICDEVYSEFAYDGIQAVSALELEGVQDNIIVVDSMSKRFSECGIRVGMIISHNKETIAGILKLCLARLSPPLLGQIAAKASLDLEDGFIPESIEEYRKRRNFFVESLRRIPGVKSPLPKGAFYTFAELPVEDAADFCQWCLTDFRYVDEQYCKVHGISAETVMMAPGSGFYFTPGSGRNTVRLAYVLEIPELERAVMVLQKAIEAYNNR